MEKKVDFGFNVKNDKDYEEIEETPYITACRKKYQEIVDLFHDYANECQIDLTIKDAEGHDGNYYLTQ